MPDRIEPPVLLSRLLTFVFATMLVVLVAMVVTLYNMYPLDRPQVFFLMSAPKNDLQVVLREMLPIDENLDNFKRTFIREYIKARNEIVPNANEMRTKWTNDANGVVYTWSTPDVYNAFISNEILDMEHFAQEDAGNTEKEVYSAFTDQKEKVLKKIQKYKNM